MGGTIELNEKERWASYYSAVLKAAGYDKAAKYLFDMAYGRFGPIHKEQEERVKNDYEQELEALNQALEKIRTSKISHPPIGQIDTKPKKSQLLEDIHAHEHTD